VTEAEAAAMREMMLEEHLVPRGVTDPAVLDAMAAVPRQRFLPAELAEYAYDDEALRIGSSDETISQPYVVAWMLQLARLAPGDRVLEIGTGTGYSAAVAAALGADVWSVERSPALSARAAAVLRKSGYAAHLVVGDGWFGIPEGAPYRAALVGCAVPEPSPEWLAQLAVGGRLVAPIGKREEQVMAVFTRTESGFLREDVGRVAFVPLRRSSR
jgi:protein-L-isoaspartate(D-aspartate) O-methyltransferase